MKGIIFGTGLAFLILLIFEAGCNKGKAGTEECNYETIETAPAKFIIDRWVLSNSNNNPVNINDQGSVDYWQFAMDSIAKYQYYLNGKLQTEQHKYWVDSLLHFDRVGGYPLTPWKYEFIDNCTLKLASAFISLSQTTLIYKRIKQ